MRLSLIDHGVEGVVWGEEWSSCELDAVVFVNETVS
jgi:hypothetical protein